MSKFRTHIGLILAMFLAISPVALYSANAATGGPRDSYITLQSPFLDASNTSDARVNQQMADGWVAKGWFGSGLLFQVAFAPVGSTINLTYTVKDKNGKPLAFTPVNLRINKGYSEAASIVSVDGVKTKGIDRPPFDQANVIHRTDAYGNVTFAVKNLDLESSGEAEPESMTSKPVFSEDKLDRLHSQMLPEVNSEQADHSVITEFHYYIPKSPIVVAATKPTIALVTPKLDATNSVTNAAKGLKQAYAPIGGDLIVVYKVTGDDGKTGVPNKVVTLKVNGGKSSLQATTDAFGYAAFTLKNADTKPNAAPAAATSAMPAASTAFATLVPEIADTTPAFAEGVEFHYYRGITTSVTKSGKDFVVSVAVAGAAGKSATVSVTGAKKTTVKISSPMQVVPVKVSAGAKTVSVVIDGKTYTSKVVAKIATSTPTINSQDAILNQPAANFFIPGSALVTLQQVWGVNLNSASGPKTLRQVADETYLALCRQLNDKVTQNDLVVGFQPGNSMQSFFSRLIDNPLAYQAMKDRLIFNSNQ